VAFVSLRRYLTGIPFHLTVRRHEKGKGLRSFMGGTGLSEEVRPVNGGLDPRVAHRGTLTLWIHGYNNNQTAIGETWQTTAAALALRGVSLEDVVAFYWPGDQWGSALASAAAYPLQVPVAREAAARLVTYLTDASHRRELRLRIVAHSLGCLLTLELIRLLDTQRDKHNITVERVLLMAAAVPQGLCKPNLGPFDRRTRMRTKTAYSTRSATRCSDSRSVLDSGPPNSSAGRRRHHSPAGNTAAP